MSCKPQPLARGHGMWGAKAEHASEAVLGYGRIPCRETLHTVLFIKAVDLRP